jgi:F-type H+-transporting ATPase subunit epsilon
MADPLHFDLVSPERLLVAAEVESVVVPGTEGYFTVLAHHAPLMSTLKPGVVEVKDLAGAVQKFFVRGGFADVTPKGLTLLADQAIPLEDLDAATFEQEVSNAEEDLANAGDNHLRRTTAESKLNELREIRRWIIPA